MSDDRPILQYGVTPRVSAGKILFRVAATVLLVALGIVGINFIVLGVAGSEARFSGTAEDHSFVVLLAVFMLGGLGWLTACVCGLILLFRRRQ